MRKRCFEATLFCGVIKRYSAKKAKLKAREQVAENEWRKYKFVSG
jgi:hypothetical protein